MDQLQKLSCSLGRDSVRSEHMRPDCERLLITLPEVAKALSVTARTVRRLIERGELPKVKVGRCVRVPALALQAWVDKQVTHAHNEFRAGVIDRARRFTLPLPRVLYRVYRGGGRAVRSRA